jgi:hypothetical protein
MAVQLIPADATDTQLVIGSAVTTGGTVTNEARLSWNDAITESETIQAVDKIILFLQTASDLALAP